ncbi:polysaccharide deacetylase family protein [Salipiger aestuarii]|uniref:polysaccharide deacetylase family protein n=1 Tax=Salipiger aestuarii TaxID=568098 RepID=UPI00123943B0|nr:polysaccharide deacetylase family protein [Salipiger aestuarii]KAA8607707.1 polysaccharide deacetylase [Salipiger aestuarii]
MRPDRYAYSAITTRPDFSWPDGKRLALYIAIGVEEYTPDTGMREDIVPDAIRPGSGAPDMVNTAWRDYGNRVGGFRLLDRLRDLGCPPTILLNTDVYDSAPDLIRAARADGAEFVGHGLRNSEHLQAMNRAEEQAYLARVRDRIAQEEGSPPGGWSSPWLAHTPHTIDLLAETGYRYLMDLRLDDQPVWLNTTGAPLLSMPYAAEVNDSSTCIGRQATAESFARMIIAEFDEMRRASRQQPLVMSIILHSFISGQPFRLAALDRAFDHIAAHRNEVWMARPAEICDAFLQAGPAGG